mmetsp:Transcript_3290/g.12540  ORF Transcript_3290/g.12540 Transcript_3290/m.12540 type:complete len:208 (+) Transcript_3290:325-948(+)
MLVLATRPFKLMWSGGKDQSRGRRKRLSIVGMGIVGNKVKIQPKRVVPSTQHLHICLVLKSKFPIASCVLDFHFPHSFVPCLMIINIFSISSALIEHDDHCSSLSPLNFLRESTCEMIAFVWHDCERNHVRVSTLSQLHPVDEYWKPVTRPVLWCSHYRIIIRIFSCELSIYGSRHNSIEVILNLCCMRKFLPIIAKCAAHEQQCRD